MRHLAQPTTRKSGWTLIELLVTISILAILVTIGFIALSKARDDSIAATAKANVQTLNQAATRARLAGTAGPGTYGSDKLAAYNWYKSQRYLTDNSINLEPLGFFSGIWVYLQGLTESWAKNPESFFSENHTDQELAALFDNLLQNGGNWQDFANALPEGTDLSALLGGDPKDLATTIALMEGLRDGTLQTAEEQWANSLLHSSIVDPLVVKALLLQGADSPLWAQLGGGANSLANLSNEDAAALMSAILANPGSALAQNLAYASFPEGSLSQFVDLALANPADWISTHGTANFQAIVDNAPLSQSQSAGLLLFSENNQGSDVLAALQGAKLDATVLNDYITSRVPQGVANSDMITALSAQKGITTQAGDILFGEISSNLSDPSIYSSIDNLLANNSLSASTQQQLATAAVTNGSPLHALGLSAIRQLSDPTAINNILAQPLSSGNNWSYTALAGNPNLSTSQQTDLMAKAATMNVGAKQTVYQQIASKTSDPTIISNLISQVPAAVNMSEIARNPNLTQSNWNSLVGIMQSDPTNWNNTSFTATSPLSESTITALTAIASNPDSPIGASIGSFNTEANTPTFVANALLNPNSTLATSITSSIAHGYVDDTITPEQIQELYNYAIANPTSGIAMGFGYAAEESMFSSHLTAAQIAGLGAAGIMW